MTNDNPHAVPVVINGKDRVLKLGPKALRIAKERHGVRVSMSELSDPDLDTMAQMLWAACLPDEPTLKLEKFIDDLDESGDLFRVMPELTQAFTRLTEGGSKGRKASGAGKGKAAK